MVGTKADPAARRGRGRGRRGPRRVRRSRARPAGGEPVGEGGHAWAPVHGERVVEDADELGGADRQQPPVEDGAVRRWPAPWRRTTGASRRVGGDVGEVGADGLDVAAHDRAGQRRVAVGERVVEGGGEQRAQRRGRVLGAGGAEQVHRLGDQGDEVVGAVREAGVVERALVLGHPHRHAAEVGDQGLGEARGRRSAAVTPKTQPGSRARSTSVPVKVIAGCRRQHVGAHARRPARARRGRAGRRCARRTGRAGSRRWR